METYQILVKKSNTPFLKLKFLNNKYSTFLFEKRGNLYNISHLDCFRDSSEEEPNTITPKEVKKNKWRKWFICSKCCEKCFPDDEEQEDTSQRSKKSWLGKKGTGGKDSSDEERRLLKEKPDQMVTDEKDEINKTKDSDYYSSDSSTDYSYSYQYDKTYDSQPVPIVTPFKDVEKQEVPDYASMSSFQEEADETKLQPKTMIDKATTAVAKKSAGTVVSGTTFAENRKGRKVEFVHAPEKSKVTVRKKKKKKNRRSEEERPLLDRNSCSCTSSDTDDSDRLRHLQTPVLTLPKTLSSSITQDKNSPYTSHSEDKEESSSASAVATETKRDIRHVKAALPQLNNLSHVQHIPVPRYDITSSSLDSEIKCNHQYVKMMVPELDLSSSTSTPRSSRNYVNDIFGNVTYDEISESPKSTSSSSRQHILSPEITSENKCIGTKHSTSKVDKEVTTVAKAKVDAGVSAQPLDRYRFEEMQREKVKQYYKAVKGIPCRKAEEKKGSGKFMKFVQKIIPKV